MNKQPHSSSDELRLGEVLTDLVNRNRKSYIHEKEIVGLGHAQMLIERLISQEAAKARIDELKNFEPLFKGDHSKCPDPRNCIGYQNAESDFDNEKELRLAALTKGGDTDGDSASHSESAEH